MAISLSSIQKTKHAAPPRMLIHGGEKVGKSTFASGAPNPIFIRTEDGLNGIDTNAFPLAKNYTDVREALLALTTQQHDFKTVVLDSADWLESIIHAEICKNENVKTVAKAGGGYGNGYIVALGYWKEVLNFLDDLNKRLNMIIIVICHSSITTINDPETESYDVATLKLHSPKKGTGAADLFAEWADVIGYAKRPIILRKTEDGAHKAVETGTNQMNELVIGKTATCVSGNRYNLPSTIPLVWQAFEDAIKNSINQTN